MRCRAYGLDTGQQVNSRIGANLGDLTHFPITDGPVTDFPATDGPVTDGLVTECLVTDFAVADFPIRSQEPHC